MAKTTKQRVPNRQPKPISSSLVNNMLAQSMSKPIAGIAPPKTLPDPDKTSEMFRYHFARGEWLVAQQTALSFTAAYPTHAVAWADAAVCAIKLESWQDAIRYALEAIKFDPKKLSALDALSHAYGALKQWQPMKIYGHKALVYRNELYGKEPYLAWQPAPVNPLQINAPERNIISFSLFGGNSKYCETGVLNPMMQPEIYPHWRCRFYVDDSVPIFVIDRLKLHGAQVFYVTEEQKKWPAPMWRFAAFDDPNVDRVIFRDADSVITTREASAVADWVASGKRFHHMRDFSTHTELVLAGLWGVTNGAMPPMQQMISDFLKKPLVSEHFADQFFLREYVWPYARQDLLQHDSVFDFLEYHPFPEGPMREDLHVGWVEGAPSFSVAVDLPDDQVVSWCLMDATVTPEQQICSYPATVKNKQINAHIPDRYAKRIKDGTCIVRVIRP